MPSVSQADLAFTAQILYPPFRTYGNSSQKTYRDMHLISRNGSLPLSERLQVLFSLISPVLRIPARLSASPRALPAAPRQPSLHPWDGRSGWQLWVRAKEKEQRSLIQVASCNRVGVCDKRWRVAAVQTVRSCPSTSGRAGRPRRLLCVHWWKGLAQTGWFRSAWIREPLMESGCVSGRSLTMLSFWIHFGCVGGFFFSFFPLFFFFFKPTWQLQRFLPLMTTSYSSSLFLAGTRSVKSPSTAVPLCARQNASLGGMSLLPRGHLWVWLSLKFCRAEALHWALGLRSPKEALRDMTLMLQLDC